MIYRPKMIVDPVLLFILRWSCSQSAVVMFGTNIEYVTLSAKLSVFVKYFTPETFSDNSKYTREKCIHGDILCVTFKIMEIVLTSNRRDNITLNHEMKKLYKRFFFHLTGVLKLKLSPRFLGPRGPLVEPSIPPVPSTRPRQFFLSS